MHFHKYFHLAFLLFCLHLWLYYTLSMFLLFGFDLDGIIKLQALAHDAVDGRIGGI